ncbi:MAG: hypothetical protein ABEJ68_04775 [Halobacteriaceae archaeon]
MADEDEPTVPVACSACGTTTAVPLSTVGDAIERHNERLHDGDDVAEVDPAIREQLSDVVAEDLGLL